MYDKNQSILTLPNVINFSKCAKQSGVNFSPLLIFYWISLTVSNSSDSTSSSYFFTSYPSYNTKYVIPQILASSFSKYNLNNYSKGTFLIPNSSSNSRFAP